MAGIANMQAAERKRPEDTRNLARGYIPESGLFVVLEHSLRRYGREHAGTEGLEFVNLQHAPAHDR